MEKIADKKTMNKFLIINPFGIGDVLFTTPLVKAIKKEFPQSMLGYWCNERVADVLKNDPAIDLVFPLSRGDIKRISRRSLFRGPGLWLGLYKKIKKEGFDTVFDFSLDHRYGLIALLAGIKRRIGYNYKNRGRFLTHKIDVQGYSLRHMIEYYFDLLKFIGTHAEDLNMNVYINDDLKRRVDTMLSQQGVKEGDRIVGVVPGGGASWGKDASFKQWPPGNFVGLIDKLTNDFGVKVVLLGDEREKEIAGKITDASRSNPINLCGKTALDELCAVINKLDVLVANDSGPLHIGVAEGIKTVSIFGPVDDLVYGPYPKSENHRVIKRHFICQPCYINFRFKGCDNNRKCLEAITIDEVYSCVKTLLLKQKHN